MSHEHKVISIRLSQDTNNIIVRLVYLNEENESSNLEKIKIEIEDQKHWEFLKNFIGDWSKND